MGDMPPLTNPEGLDSRSWGPFRQEWYSACSRHRARDDSCVACGYGRWVNVCLHAVSLGLYRVAPRAWRWIAKQVRHL